MISWARENIIINGRLTDSIAPLIISASRATDIPAFYARDFFDQLSRGFLFWTNPFNGVKTPVSLGKVRLIVFWTKNPDPILPFLPILEKKKIDFYFNYTLNNYEQEGIENNLPSIDRRINSFVKLSKLIGKEKVIWRFDPVVTLSHQSIDQSIDKMAKLAELLHLYTNKMVFSFVDTSYLKVRRNFEKAKITLRTCNDVDKKLFARKLSERLGNYALKISTCAEQIDFEEFGITHNKCIDDELISNIFKDNDELIAFIELLKSKSRLKDSGQREFCGCIPSKDVGRYNSCRYQCTYCYAGNFSAFNRKIDIFN